MDVRKNSSHHQKEAEKCNTEMDTGEEAKEKAEVKVVIFIKFYTSETHAVTFGEPLIAGCEKGPYP